MARKTAKLLVQIFDYYSGGANRCACCGEQERDFLTLDHVAGNSNKTSVALGIPRAGANLYFWLARNSFPHGYQILCMNCNMSKGKHGGICAHKRISPVQ